VPNDYAIAMANNVIADHRPIQQSETKKLNGGVYLRLIRWLLYILAAVSFAWPAYRLFLNIEIENNEGWNAYFADAALGKMPLYPSAAQLITNNYPPLSFYIVGLAGRILGDPVLAGRLLSLVATAAVATAIALIVRRLGGTKVAAIVSASFYIATMSRFFMSYVGMNEPQLLAEAIMAFGFLGFLIARSRDRGYVGPVMIMALTGFVKHNVIAMPLTAFTWLGLNRRRQFGKCVFAAAVVIVTGTVICYFLYGRAFFFNILSPRHYSVIRSLQSYQELQWVSIGLLACACNAWASWHCPSVRLCSCFITIALASFLLQKTGDGVDVNAQFDLVIAVSIGLGLAYTRVPLWPLARGLSPARSQAILLLAILVRLLVSKQFQPVRVVSDPSFRAEIATRQRIMAEEVERVRRIPGDVLCPLLVSYKAGKPFVVDTFNAEQRIAAGVLPKNAITERVTEGSLTIVEVDERARWGTQEKHFDFGSARDTRFSGQSHSP
jgi:hypothetical protein